MRSNELEQYVHRCRRNAEGFTQRADIPCCEGCVTVENIMVVAVVLPAPTGRFGSGTQGTDGPIMPRRPVW